MLLEAFEAAFPSHDFKWNKSGSSAKGLCPFHQDRNHPSLSVYLDAKGHERWHCHAEGIGGTVFDMVRRSGIEGTETYAGANRWLVRKGYLQESEQQVSDRVRNTGMQKFYQWTNELLATSDAAAGVRAYLAKRHIDVRTIPHAMVGYYPTVDEVMKWLAENDLVELLGSELIPERRLESMATGSIILFYRSSYEEFTRVKLRNVCREQVGGQKCTLFLGKKLRATDSLGYFSWSKEGCISSDAIIVEGEFDAGALASLVYRTDTASVEPIYCFSGGNNISKGVDVLVAMGKQNIYIFPDNDGPGIDYSYKIAELHPQTFVIMPKDYKPGDDPAAWAADHSLEDLNAMYNARRPAFAWIGQRLARSAADATIEEQANIKAKLIEYAKRLPATDREMFLKNYGSIAGVSFEALQEEVEARSNTRYRRVLTPESNFGTLMNVAKKSKEVEWEPISNVILELEHDIVLDDGDGDIERLVLVRASTFNKTERIEMSIDDYLNDTELTNHLNRVLGSKYVWIKPKFTSYLRESAQLLSVVKTGEHARDEYVYTHTGWRDMAYYMPSGYIDVDGFHEHTEARVELPSNPKYMSSYFLNPPPADLTDSFEIIKEHLLKAFQYEITLPFLCHTFWSVIANFVPDAKPNCLWVVGLTGSYKTSYSALMASFFGDFTSESLETWRSTKNAIEKNGYFLKDALLVVDDYKGIDVSMKDIVSCIQSYGDRHGRSRMKGDGTNQKTWFIRANMVTTAEDVPEGEASVLSRTLLLKIPKGGDLYRINEAHQNRHLFPGVMSKFIQFFLSKKPNVRDLNLLLAERRFKYPATHGRTSEALAANSIAWDYVREFFGLEDLDDRYEAGLQIILANMNLSTQQEQAGYVFKDTLCELIEEGSHYLAGTQEGLGTPHREGATKIGYMTPNSVYLLGGIALTEVNKRRFQTTGAPIKYTRQTIYEQLVAAGLVIPDSRGNPTKPVKINRQTVRALEFRRGVLEHYDETSNTSKPTSGVVWSSEGKVDGLEHSGDKLG